MNFEIEEEALALRRRLEQILEETRKSNPELGEQIRVALDEVEQAIERQFPGLLEP